jgi:cardiolipin synthase C
VLAAAVLGGCALPPVEPRSLNYSLIDTQGTQLARTLAPALQAHAGTSGFYSLPVDREAFAARELLAQAAERSIDAQYYLWNADRTGYLLLQALWEAADRGVRVRLLIDDQNTKGLDGMLAAFAAHRNAQVRLFNPLRYRRARWLNYLTSPARINHRMHNKCFIVDGQVAIIGGRNIGDEYFDAGAERVYADLDMIAVGPVVHDASDEFDLYWNSSSAYVIEALVDRSRWESAAALEQTFAANHAAPASQAYLAVLNETTVVTSLRGGRLAFEWTTGRLVYDRPAKVYSAREEVLLLSQLWALAERPGKQFDLVSPYFVPGERASKQLGELAGDGVHVRILTNSLQSTDVLPVHVGYIRYREGLLKSGVVLYELRRDAALRTVAGRRRRRRASSGLHAKTFQLDGERVFVGSFNFDPRSARLNTEMGMLIDSTRLAQELAHGFDVDVPQEAYQVRLAPDGHGLEWIARDRTAERLYTSEPGETFGQRVQIAILSVLPIEGLL